jgi:hypothetical protein
MEVENNTKFKGISDKNAYFTIYHYYYKSKLSWVVVREFRLRRAQVMKMVRVQICDCAHFLCFRIYFITGACHIIKYFT